MSKRKAYLMTPGQAKLAGEIVREAAKLATGKRQADLIVLASTFDLPISGIVTQAEHEYARRYLTLGDGTRAPGAEELARSMTRRFLTRAEATRDLGLVDASLKREPQSVRVACKDRETGEVYEAVAGECLHAQIALRVNRARNVIDGWTSPAE